MNQTEIRKQLINLIGTDNVIVNAPMKDQIAFRVGGPADFLVTPETTEQLAALLNLCHREAWPYYLMGNGSNLLVRDGGYRGIIIKTRSMDTVEVSGQTIVAEAGAMLRKIADIARTHHLSGLEFAFGIPGSLGGAVVMNAGAYGGEMKDVITEVDMMTESGELLTLQGKDCDFGYRTSLFQNNGGIVTRVRMTLSPGNAEAIGEEMRRLNALRREKQPLEYPSAGSTFRRPEGYFAGKLIQDCGMKGYRVGGAQVSEKHAGFVINLGDATAGDILAVIKAVQEQVWNSFGVHMKTEVIVIGEE